MRETTVEQSEPAPVKVKKLRDPLHMAYHAGLQQEYVKKRAEYREANMAIHYDGTKCV